MHMAQELLTATQLQDMFDVDRSTIYRMAGDGRLPAIKIGRQWRFPAGAIRELLGEFESHRLGEDADLLIEMVAGALGVMVVVTDLEGRPLTPVMNPCPRFVASQDDPEAVAACAHEWREMAESNDPRPFFQDGALGFLCARAFVRDRGKPTAMVLAGGVAKDGDDADDLFVLSAEQRRRVVSTLPKVASLLTKQRSNT